MTQADRIRQFVIDRYFAQARALGRSEITLRAGDVHQAMSLANAMPAVCSAIGSNKFQALARATLVKWTGPANGANVYLHFRLTADPLPQQPESLQQSVFRPAATKTADLLRQQPVSLQQSVFRAAALDLANAIVLVSCVKSKLPDPAPARALYTSTWFRKTCDIVEGNGARWFILSSLYGLVAPDAKIAPYDYTLNTLGVAERRNWAKEVLAKLLPQIADERRIVMFAGHRYREFLVDPLRRLGIKVDVPMANLTRGEQLAWLSESK